jgi:hypothetical protein
MNRQEGAIGGGVRGGVDRGQSTLFPALLDDYVAEDKRSMRSKDRLLGH